MADIAQQVAVDGEARHVASIVSEPLSAARDRRSWTRSPGAKRALDIVGASAGLVLLAPVFAVVALAVKLDSSGPAFFRQQRVGKDGGSFEMYKFRSMIQGCDAALHREHVVRLIKGDAGDECRGSDGSFKLEADPRVTQVGKFLRRTSLDELPQLFNVLKGDMSLVGPRPPLPYEAEAYTERHARRLRVVPGITGLWQVSGRTRLSFEQMIDLDLEYAQTWSVVMDLKIILKTFSVVIGGQGAG